MTLSELINRNPDDWFFAIPVEDNQLIVRRYARKFHLEVDRWEAIHTGGEYPTAINTVTGVIDDSPNAAKLVRD